MELDQNYHVVEHANTYAVVDSGNRTVITCNDKLNAQHYAELLSHAYVCGYKAGYKARGMSDN